MKIDDIEGFRRSHKKIPTKTAMLADQDELKARQAAIGQLKEPVGGNMKGRKPLSSYGNFDMSMARGFGEQEEPEYPTNPKEQAQWPQSSAKRDPKTRAPSLESWEQGGRDEANERIRDTMEDEVLGGQLGAPVNAEERKRMRDALSNIGEQFGGVAPTQGEKAEEDKARYDPFGMREDLQMVWEDNLDPVEKEKRITRQRAAQEAAVRARMGQGEAGRSGAAALLEGEAGRLAESQARTAELGRELQMSELGTYLMGFDLAKERYNDAEQQQAAMAAFYIGTMYDMDYDQVMDFLGIPEAARTDTHRNAYNEWHSAEYDEDTASGSYYEVFEDVNAVSAAELDDYIEEGGQLLETREDGTRLVLMPNGKTYSDEPGGYPHTGGDREDGSVSGDGDSDLIAAINAGEYEDVEVHGDSTSVPDGYVEIGRDDNYIWYYSSEDNEVRKAEITRVRA